MPGLNVPSVIDKLTNLRDCVTWIIKFCFIYLFFFFLLEMFHHMIKELVLYALIYSFETLKLFDRNMF